MPQMAPLLWLPLFMFMTMTIIWVKSNSFFMFNLTPSTKSISEIKPNTVTWQW